MVVAMIYFVDEGFVFYTLHVWEYAVLGVLSLLIVVTKIIITHRFHNHLSFKAT